MAISSENLRLILGLKLKNLRHDRGLSLKQLAQEAGLSISYLSEIEKGKKYPKPEKLLSLANALGVPFDELVSVHVDEALHPLADTLRSSFFSEFPFALFGFETQDIFSLLSSDPAKAGALFQTFLEIGQMYDMRVEHFLFAALRSYQQLHDNYFEEIEQAAASMRSALSEQALEQDAEAALRKRLERYHGYRIDFEALGQSEELSGFRSVFADGAPPTLHVNARLSPVQRAFVFGRELGYRTLGLKKRAVTSSWLKVESFEQVLNNFKASYFAGAVLIGEQAILAALTDVFSRSRWHAGAFLSLLGQFRATPEMLFYRMGQLVPRHFGLEDLFFLRVTKRGSEPPRLTKVFNQSRLSLPQGFWLDENYCQRWCGNRLLAQIAPDSTPEARVRVQRSRFAGAGDDHFVFSLARPLTLSPETWSSVSLGFRLDEAFRQRIAFADDPAIEDELVNITCERCPFTESECSERVAPATLIQRQDFQSRKEAALARLIGT